MEDSSDSGDKCLPSPPPLQSLVWWARYLLQAWPAVPSGCRTLEEPCAWVTNGHSGPPLDLGPVYTQSALLGGTGGREAEGRTKDEQSSPFPWKVMPAWLVLE